MEASVQVSFSSSWFEQGTPKGSAERLESFIFGRTGQEKGQAPGRQINLMKFVIDCGNISLVIKAGISHKKLLIKTLPLSPSLHFLLHSVRNHCNCSQPCKDSKAALLPQILKGHWGSSAWCSHWQAPGLLMFYSELCPLWEGAVSCTKHLLPCALCTPCSAPGCPCWPSKPNLKFLSPGKSFSVTMYPPYHPMFLLPPTGPATRAGHLACPCYCCPWNCHWSWDDITPRQG